MKDEFFRISGLTGRKYDVFKTVKILNISQATAYIHNGVFPIDIKVGYKKDGETKCLIFYFDRDESKEVYNKWCNYELD